MVSYNAKMPQEKPKSFVEWLSTETIGVVVLTTITSFSVQSAIQSIQILCINYQLRNNSTKVFNPFTGNINYVDNPTTLSDEIYTTNSQSAIDPSATTTTRTSSATTSGSLQNPSSTYANPIVLDTILLIVIRLVLTIFTAYLIYRVLLWMGMCMKK